MVWSRHLSGGNRSLYVTMEFFSMLEIQIHTVSFILNPEEISKFNFHRKKSACSKSIMVLQAIKHPAHRYFSQIPRRFPQINKISLGFSLDFPRISRISLTDHFTGHDD